MLETLSNAICLLNQKLHLPASLAIILETLSCFQILQLILETMASSTFSQKPIMIIFTKSLPFFTGAFDFDSFSPLQSIIHPAWYLITLYLFGHILLILATVFIFSQKKAFNAATLRILAIVYTVHSRILFFPIHYFYLTLIKLYKDEHLVNSTPFYSQPAWFAITIIFLVENFLLVLIKEVLLYQTTKSKDYSAVKTNLYHQIIAVHKICLSIILVLARDLESTAKLSSILHLILSLGSIATLYRCLPFYKFKALKTSAVLCTINLSTSVVGILQAFVKDAKVLDSLQIVLFMLPVLGVKISLGMFKDLLGRISVMRIKSPLHAIHFFLLMKEACLENEVSEYQDKSFLPEKQLILGFFSRNGINLLDMKDPTLKKECEPQVYTLILKKFEERYTWSPKNELLLSFIIRIYLKKFGNIAKGTHYLRKIENLGYSIHVKSYVNDFHTRLEEIYQKEYLKDDDGIKLSKYFRHKEMANSVRSGLLKEIEKHVDVWEHLQNNIIDIKKIVDIVEEIDTLFTETNKKFNRNLDEFRSNFPLPILMYAAYLHSIRCLPYEADQLFKVLQNIVFNKTTRSDFDTYSDTSAVVIISLDPRKAGLIIDATGSIQNVFGVKKNEIVGFNFACLFPHSIAKAYQQEVSQYARAPTYKLDKTCKTYGKTGTGEIFELDAHFKLYSYGNKEITIAITFTQLSGPKSLFIANYSGHIIECSKDLQSNLQKEQLHLKAFRFMQDLALDFEVVNQAFNQIYDADDHLSLKTNPYTETKVTRFADGKVPTTIFLETDALSARPLLNTNTEVLASVVRDNESLIHVGSSSRRQFQKYTLDRLPSNFRTPPKIHSHLLTSSGKKEELNYEKAKKICNRFTQGRRVDLLPTNSTNTKLKANVKIKPLVLNREVHKIIYVTSIEPEKSSLADLDNDSQDSGLLMSGFADAFPENSEGISMKQIPGLSLRPKTSRRPGNLRLSPTTQRSNFDFDVFSSETLKSHSRPSAPDQKKDRLIREIKAQEDHLRSTTDTKFREGGALKALKKISSSTKMLPLIKYLMLVIYLILIFIITLAGISTGLSRKSTNEVSYAVQIVDIVTQRSFCVEQFWQYTTTLYASGLGLATFPNATLKGIRGAMGSARDYLVPSNSNLKSILGKLDSKNLVKTAYKRDVAFYNYYGTSVQRSEMEIFTSTDLLLAKYEPVITLQDLTKLPKDPDIPFLLNNTGNDYMIKSKLVNDLTHDFLEETTTNKIKTLRAALATQIFALLLLTTAFILIPFVIVKAYKRLLKALLKIPDIRMNERLNTIQTIQTLFKEDIEDKSFILGAYKQFGDPEPKSHSKRSRPTNNTPHQRHEYTMTKMNKYLIKLELSALVFIPIFVTLFVVGLNRSISTFQSFSVVNDQMAVLKDCWDRSNMVLGSFAFAGVFITNPSMLIKNNVPIQQLRSDLEAFRSVNEKLTSTFIKGDDTDPLIESIFKDSICNNLLESRQAEFSLFCLPATKGGTIGMLVLNEDYLSASDRYAGAFLDNPSLLTLLAVALPYLNAVSNLLSTLNVTYPVLIRRIREGFETEVTNSLRRELDYFFAIFAMIVVYLVFIYFVPVRRLKRADSSRRKILKVIPLKMIQENKIFSWYLINEFQNEIPSIKRYF